jgi:hypothetical protein
MKTDAGYNCLFFIMDWDRNMSNIVQTIVKRWQKLVNKFRKV